MNRTRRGLLTVGMFWCVMAASHAVAQEAEPGSDPFGDSSTADAPLDTEAEPAPEEGSQPPSEATSPEPETPQDTEAPASGVAVNLSVDAAAGDTGTGVDNMGAADADELSANVPHLEAAEPEGQTMGSHILRPRLEVDGVLISDGPLRTTFSDRAALERGRQLGGISVPDTTAALGLGAPSTVLALRNRMRLQPTAFLLNGRRLVSAPFVDRFGADLVDLNQIPVSLISRIETTSGLVAGLYGDGAIGGVVNYITHRNYDGLEIDLGGQITDDLNQHQADITLTAGAGNEKTGMNVMVSYFNREPLAASDRSWVTDRLERHESLVGNPATYQPLINFVEYPFADPACGTATGVGDASGQELRIPLFGEPTTLAGGNALELLPIDNSMDPPLDYAQKYLNNFDSARGDADGQLEAGETSTFCGNDLTRFQDLIVSEERLQSYATFWHAFSDHVEGFGELGYYRNENRNRTSPSFPVTRITASEAAVVPVVVPKDHADIPLQSRGFAIADDVPVDARAPNDFFLVGSPLAPHAGNNIQERRSDTFRAVLGLRGDLKDLGEGSVLESWNWELAGVYSASQAVTRVSDILLDKLGDALNSCAGTTIDEDVSSATYMMPIPSSIKDRQEDGCFNPFYSSVTNNVAVDPLNQSSDSVSSSQGFITSDTETNREVPGFGLQDGGFICDPSDPNSTCPEAFDTDGDGIYELAGTPNTKRVIDGMTGEHITQETRTLTTADFVLSGDAVQFDGGQLAFGLGGQFRRETLSINYDAAFNQHRYAFLFGAPDVEPIGRNIGAGFAEARLRIADGLLEVQGAGRLEHFQGVGTAFSPLGGLAVRPFAGGDMPAFEWLLLRGHVGLGNRAPSLLQQYGTYTEFRSVEFNDANHFIPHQVQGNPDLDFEKYTTFSGGLQWDYLGLHLGADYWITMVDDVIGADNVQTLTRDCDAQYYDVSRDCDEMRFVSGMRTLNHVESPFDNLAEVESNGIDGSLTYTLDTHRRGLGDAGTFMLGVQGRLVNSYLIKSPRALREYYRQGGGRPDADQETGVRDYSGLTAEYEAAGYRNIENFAPPMPKLRFAVPLRWFFEGHVIGATMRYTGSYNDDSESTIEKYGLTDKLAGGRASGTIPTAEGETIDTWTVFDLNYGFSFGDDDWHTQLAVGVINLLGAEPPGAESPMGYDIGIHDPRGRMVYARATGKF